MSNKNYYFCYSKKLKDFLLLSGIRYEFVGVNLKSKKPYWGFIRNDNLSDKLNKWSNKYDSKK